MLKVLIGIAIGVALTLGIVSVNWDKALQVKQDVQHEVQQFTK